jgi:sialic acid synthase SpsE
VLTDHGRKLSERVRVKFRRLLYFVKDAYEGKVITLSHIKSIKPGCRVVLKFDGNLFGKMVKQDIKQSMLTNWSLMHV